MKKVLPAILAAVLTVVLVGTLALPQAQAATVNTKKGSCDLLFKFNGLSDLSVSAYKGGFGIRHFLQDDLAIRPMVTFGMSSTKNKAVTSGGSDAKETLTDLGAEVTIEKYMPAMGPVAPYVGGQAGVSYQQTKDEVGGTTTGKIKSTNFGVGVVAGFQWGFTEAVTLGGEYSLSASFGSGSHEDGNGNKTSDVSRTDIGIGTASLFVSLRWK